MVDDDRSVRETICEILTESGFECLVAPDGRAAIDLFVEAVSPIHVVILDWAMPGLDGADTYRRLRGINPQVKAILMSGYQRCEEVENLVAEGVKAFVSKPFEIENLLQAIQRVIAM